MSFTFSLSGARSEMLASDELELLADVSLGLADRYERDAEFMDDDEGGSSHWSYRDGGGGEVVASAS